MKAYETRNAVALRKRVKKVHSKAKLVGFLYLLGTLALAAFACLPMLGIGGTDLWVVNFWQPFLKILSADRDVLALIVAVLYAFVVLTGVINFFKALGKLGWLTKRASRYVNGYNRNMRAMDDMGKIFSGSFAALVNFHLLIYILQPADAEVKLTIYAYAALAVGLVIHFLAGLIGGKVSFFNVGGPNGNVEEEKRSCGLFVYFFRNLVQVAATAAIVYFFVSVCTLNQTVAALLAKSNPFTGDIIKTVLPVALQALLVIWILILVKHATASTEFNRFGIEGAGMKNYRVFSFFTVLTAGGAFALEYLATKSFGGVATKYLIVAGIALAAFLIDCIFKSKPKDEETEEESEMQPLQPQYMPYPANAPAGQTVVYAPAQNGAPVYQPIYIPVYYPYPVHNEGMPASPAPVCAPVPAPASPYANAAVSTGARPAPAPAPSYLKPAPSPATQAAEGKNEVREKRRDIKDRNAMLKREKAAAKQNKKIAKKNAKKEKRLVKQEESFVKKTAVTATEMPAQSVPALSNVVPATSGAAIGMPAMMNAPALTNVPETTNVVPAPVVETPAPVEDEIKEITAVDLKKEWKVRCPRCGKELLVSERTPYHRCPSCDKVFQIRKFETYVKKS
ncbi:MAG: hypothetical protein IJX91_05760 [Clostridia bacterium]|nr:hypothetical protein [Clostridia bacterium]